MRLPTLLPLLILGWLAATSATPRRPLDAEATLAKIERARGGPSDELAAMERGQFHFVRGEYALALTAFERAVAARGPRRGEALHSAGLCRLALGETTLARDAFREAARADAGLRPLAALGMSFAWERDERPDRAIAELSRVGEHAGEAGPAMLERLGVLAARLGRSRERDGAWETLRSRYPQSFEAVRAGAAGPR